MSKNLKDISLLYVDDEDDVANIIKIILKPHIGSITIAKNGLEGLCLFLEQRYDIIVTDISMPVMDGIEMVERIREKDREQPIIALTAHSEEEIHQKALNAGVDKVVLKPLNLKKLLQEIKSLQEDEKDA